MRGVGGPLLCIGDLLSDVGDGDGSDHAGLSSGTAASSPSPIANPSDPLRPSDLSLLFQENYKELNRALEGTDHSWTALTLKLCSALDTADKLVQTANANSIMLSEKVEVLQNIVRQGDSAVNTVKLPYGVQSVKASIGSNERTRNRS